MFDEVKAELQAADGEVVERKMFGHPCLMVGGKGFAVDHYDAIVLKLPEEVRDEALALAGAHLFDPMGGRPMKEWVQIPDEFADDWLRYARYAKDYVKRIAAR